jgi:hypothetical protein
MTTDIKHTSNQTASRHTPGPWVIAGSQIHDRVTFFDENGARTGETPNSIAEVHAMPFGEQEANARLIAAAPALVEALERIIEILPSGSQPWEANSQEVLARETALAAIAEAKGLAA